MNKKKQNYKPKCVLFDADGVIINTGEQMSQKYVRKFGVDMVEFEEFFKGSFLQCLIGKSDLKVEVKPYLKRWEWNGTVDEFLAWWFDAEHCIDNKVLDTIKKLKQNDVPVYLATNQEKYRGKYMKTEMGFDKLFDKVFVSADVGFKKPDEAFYKYILTEIKKDCGAETDEVLFFDDSRSNIAGAKKVGMKAYFYKDFNKDMLSVLARYWKEFRFDDWCYIKKQVNNRTLQVVQDNIFVHPGEIWWSHWGKNIGFEEHGKGKNYSRPIVVIQVLSRHTFLAAPLTTSSQKHSMRIPIGEVAGRQAKVVISQIRVIDINRVQEFVMRIDKKHILAIKKAIVRMLR